MKYFLSIITILFPLIVIATAIWAYNDIKKFNKAGVKTLDPTSWSALIVIFWIVMFPLYLIFRFSKYNKKNIKFK